VKHPLKSFSSTQDKLADFFDVQQQKGESLDQFRQKLVSISGSYRNQSDEKKVIRSSNANEKKDLKEVEYQVIGYDENLINMKKKNGQKINISSMATKIKAEILFNNMSAFVRENIPEKYVDHNGNVWGRI